MKKLICLISAAAILAGLPVRAATLNEWNFYSDPVGKTLSNSFNSAGTASFALNSGYNDTGLRTDGFGTLICTNNDPGTNGMWTSGAVLDAATSNLTSGTFFLRYDFEYDLSATNNNSGTLLGFAFTDSTGAKVAGAALQYDIGSATAPTNLTVTQVADLGSNYTGSVSIITKVDMATQKLAVWYDLSGTGSFSAESSPQASNITVNLPSINKLRLQATGDFAPAGSDDSASISLLRMTDSFADAASEIPVAPPAKYSNEWTFERDLDGLPLSGTINSGTNSPLAQFGTGFGSTVFTTNRALRCIGNDSGTNGVWTNGAILNAALPAATSGVHYLRYDVVYDLSSTNNNSGTLLGVYFTDSTGDKAAGLVLGYEQGNLATATPTNRTLTSVTNGLPLSGTLTAIAEVNLDTDTLKVWYDLSGSNTFNTNSPAVSTNITLSTINNLRFHATGDFRPAGSTDYAAIDNIRHTASLSEIIEPPADLTAPPKLSVSVSDSLNGSMETGETNIVTVIIGNSGGPATNATSTLTHNGLSAAFTVVSNNAPVALGSGASITNTYILTANSNSNYLFTVQAVAGTNSAETSFPVIVGSHISCLTNTVIEVSGGTIPGKYEPGETVNITVTSTNDGARTVTNVTSTLSANPAYFTITPASTNYPAILVGRSITPVYSVAISNTTPAGTYIFSVTNRSGSLVWRDSFVLDVFAGALPSVTNTLLIEVASGEVTNKTLILNNSGNASATFSVSDDGMHPTDSYTLSMITKSMEPFNPVYDEPDPASSFTNWNGSSTVPMNIGFTFPLDGVSYTNFSVSAYGAVVLGGSSVSNNPNGILPFGTDIVIAPFWGNTAVDVSTVRYKKENDRLVISWGNRTGSEFQAWLYQNGQILYLYDQGFSGTAAIGLQGKSHFLQTTLNDLGSGETGFLFTLKSWITYAPLTGTVPSSGSTPVTFTADADGKSSGTNVFNVYVTWGDGSTSTVAVTVKVLNSIRGLKVTPASVNFSGPAGFITQTNVSLINTGNVSLAYTIVDGGAQSNGYTSVNTNYQWQNTGYLDANEITWTGGTDEGYSQLIPIGFPFPFYGNAYTQLCIGVNGGISLGTTSLMTSVYFEDTNKSATVSNWRITTNALASTVTTNLTSPSVINIPDRLIAPYWGDLKIDANANVRYFSDANQIIITWENMQQIGGGNDLTFQTILNRDGSIRFQYNNLTGSDIWPYTQIGLRDTPARTTSVILSNSLTTVIITNYTTTQVPNPYEPDDFFTVTVTNLVVGYINTVTEQAVRFIPSGGRTIISASPLSGTIPAGGTNIVTLYGDARSLTSNGVNSVTNSTTFSINYTGGTNSLPAKFVATNSVETAYSAALAEWLAGTDDFVTSVSQGANGVRTISWPAANDSLPRTYKVWYTLDLLQDFQWLATVENGTSYVDTAHNDAPVIYYKVTVQ